MTLLFALIILTQAVPDTLTIHDCYAAAEQHYPLAQQLPLYDEIARLGSDNLTAVSLPAITLGSQAIYYSDVPSLAGPNPVSPANDQYKASVRIEQPIYDGGLRSSQRTLATLQSALDKERIKTELLRLHDQVNKAYMGILIHGAQIATFDTVAVDLNSRLATVQSQINNGVLLRSSQDVLEVELLRNDQRRLEAQSNLDAARAVLGLLIGRDLSDESVFVIPTPDLEDVDPDGRLQPEFRLMDINRQQLDGQTSLLSKRRNPQVGAFLETAYGRPPGLNFFDNQLTPFYSVGVQLRWRPWDWRITDRDKAVVELRRRIIDFQEETLAANTALVVERQRREISMLREQIDQDDKIIELRARITRESGERLEQGVLTASQYITDVNLESQARLTRSIHGLQLIQSQLAYLTTLGERQ